MALDPRIPMSFNPTQIGPDLAAAMQGARSAWQVDAYRRDAQGLDATKKVFADPASLDKDGNPTPEAMRQVMTASPEVGMKLRENVLLSQQRQLQTNLLKSKTFEQQYEMTNGVAEEALVAYQTAMDGGAPKDAALKRGQEVWTQGLDRLRSSGQFSEAQQQSWKPQFDPATAQSHAWSYGDYMKWKHQKEQEDLAQRRENRLENPDKYQILTDPNNLDEGGNPVQYRYNLADPTRSTTLDGLKPYVPKGAQKLGTAPQAKPDMLVDPENLDASGKPTPYVYDKVAHRATTLDGKPYVPHSAEKLAGPAKSGEHWVVQTDPLNKDEEGNPTPYRYDINHGKATTLDGQQEYQPKGVQKVGGPQKPLTENQQKAADLKAFAEADIAAAEKDGTKLSPKDKAAIHESYRLKALTDEQMAKDNARAIPEETAQNVARQFVETGNQNILSGWRRSPVMLRQIENAITDEIKKQHLTPEEVVRRTADFGAFTQGVKAFEAGGKLEPLVRYQNVAVQHLDVLHQAAQALQNGNAQLLNYLRQDIIKWSGGREPTNFAAVNQIVQEEILKAVQGSAGALGDREEARKAMGVINSPAQLFGVIEQYENLMAGQLNGLKRSYDRLGTGKDFNERFLDPMTITVMGKRGYGSPSFPTPPAGALEMLKSDPSKASQFDKIFGPGAAKKALGN